MCVRLQVKLSEVERVNIRMPVGGPGGGGMVATLSRQDLEKLSVALFRRARLPVDQACWQVTPAAFPHRGH